jgi:hypothetical protein
MRKLLAAALAGATVAGGLAVAGAANAQYYRPYYPPAYGYQAYPGYPASPAYPYDNRDYDNRSYYGNRSGAANALSILGSVLGLNYSSSFYSRVPVDQYGPDPNGMIGPDGRRIKCKLRRSYDSYYGGYMTRRECWAR